jgi:hypothetical protein
MLNTPVFILTVSHLLGFVRHYYDGTQRENVTDGRTKLASATV